jgi:hypothetical protein
VVHKYILMSIAGLSDIFRNVERLSCTCGIFSKFRTTREDRADDLQLLSGDVVDVHYLLTSGGG